MNSSEHKIRIAIIGGTGALGTGLALRWSAAGYPIIIGSRKLEKAESAVDGLQADLEKRDQGAAAITPMENYDAAAAGELVVLTVPFAHHRSTLEGIRPALEGKILVDVTVPLQPPKVATVQLPPEGCAAVAAQRILGDKVRVVSALQNVAAIHLQSGHTLDCDVLVCGDDKDAREEVVRLIRDMDMRAYHAGPLANSVAAESLTSVLITINRRYKCHAGIRITGIPDDGPDSH